MINDEDIPDPDVEAIDREHESIIPEEFRQDERPTLETEEDSGTASDLDDDDEPDPDTDDGEDVELPEEHDHG